MFPRSRVSLWLSTGTSRAVSVGVLGCLLFAREKSGRQTWKAASKSVHRVTAWDGSRNLQSQSKNLKQHEGSPLPEVASPTARIASPRRGRALPVPYRCFANGGPG